MVACLMGHGIMCISLKNITVSYNQHPAVHHVSGEFKSGSLTAIVGPNGAGKTTLIKLIAGLIEADEGELLKDDIGKQHIAYIPQQTEIDRNFPVTLFDFIIFAHWHRTGIFKGINKSMQSRARAALKAVGLEGFENRPLDTLSLGQFQRALFARAMLQDAKLILLDEPFTHIDTKTTNDLLEIMRNWHREKRTVIVVLHDLEQVRENFPETLMVARECIAWGKTKDILVNENISKARKMMEAWDEEAALCMR